MWPFGVAFTSWSYIWRTTTMHRREVDGVRAEDMPPALPDGVSRDGIQLPEDGSGPLFHRTYTGAYRDAGMSPEELIAWVSADPNRIAPVAFARFRKQRGEAGRLAVGDEFEIEMPGPWDGPVRCVDRTPTSFRFATLDGHLEAGQIEWRARDGGETVQFQIESWSRPGDRLSSVMHHRLRMAKEVQLHMWTSVLERVVKLCDGRMTGGIEIHTRVADFG